jgi:hypothetical protein
MCSGCISYNPSHAGTATSVTWQGRDIATITLSPSMCGFCCIDDVLMVVSLCGRQCWGPELSHGRAPHDYRRRTVSSNGHCLEDNIDNISGGSPHSPRSFYITPASLGRSTPTSFGLPRSVRSLMVFRLARTLLSKLLMASLA